MLSREHPGRATEAPSRRRRLHPLAMFMPFGSYSGPWRPVERFAPPGRITVAMILVAFVVLDAVTDAVTVTEDGSVFVERTSFTWVDALVLTAPIGVMVAMFVRWWSFRWWIEDDAIWTSGGIVNRWRRRVALGHIVAIDRSSSPLQRLFGVSRIAIETPTIDRPTPDVLLGCLSKRDTTRLENLLVSKLIFEDDTGRSSRFDPLPIDRLGWWELAVSGATTVQVTRAWVFLYALVQGFEFFTEHSLIGQYDQVARQYFSSTYLVVEPIGILVALWLASTIHFAMSFSRFRLGKHGGWLVVQTGVIRPMRRFIKIDAIQGIEISRSPLQRRFRKKRAMLRMRMPAYGAPAIYAMVLHPAITDTALPALTRQIVGMDPATSEALCGQRIVRLSAGCRRAYILYWPTRIAACCVALLLLILFMQPQHWWWALTPLAVAPALAIAGRSAWQSAGWHADHGDWLVIQRGVFGLTSTAARVDRIQYVAWSRPLLARHDPAVSMAIAVATSGGAGIVSRLLAALRRPIQPSIIRLRALDATTARGIAMASGYERSLPAELAVE